jgi:D-aminopeptidase
MKIYISADIEGTTGIAHWDEADRAKSDYEAFRSQMTAEVKAACEGANQAGAKEIKRTTKKALSKNISKCKLKLPSKFEMEILYIDSRKAYKNSFYPGAELLDVSTILFQCEDYFDILRFLSFTSHG